MEYEFGRFAKGPSGKFELGSTPKSDEGLKWAIENARRGSITTYPMTYVADKDGNIVMTFVAGVAFIKEGFDAS